ncbi:spore germination cell wall hydrolase CwlJ-like protein [Sphingomonas kyeonggiensis]|uniref:Spore germination cell wall hydrolase CwlJ-like protein n=1 Tax=Sphingomonas kyeonggiensis TaxID=1268553 RepID=A0A7W7NUR4_9SPHN|nr:cell wall hydrolase [Sphingomonas kyeonggiensis]MBB4841084.1 spore germination cell wall hydrolase CwlJ-like protein [Sphingomonas kyeonggiensis]
MFWRRFSKMQARGIAAAIVASLIGAGFSAQALAPDTRPKADPKPVAVGYEAEDHFPGAAFYYAVDDDAAVSAGTTGTTALPDMPIPADALDAPVDGSIQPALPFHLAGSGVDKARALQCLTTAIYYEAANEPSDGQRAVAQVILNRVRHPAFPATVCGVVFQGSEKRGCQFSFACDGAMARAPMRSAWDRAARVAAAALSGQVFGAVGEATHYHTYAVTPSWNRSLVMTGVFGAHFFHRWKGWWGTAAAFRQAYRGGEPLPQPHARIDLADAIAPVVPVPAMAAALPAKPSAPIATPRENIQPAYAQSGTPIGGYMPKAAPSASPMDQGESQILDKWKDSGKPLR